MSKSIWDVRFSKNNVAQDADGENWITIKGAHVLVDDDGTVVGGAGGKFNGMNYNEARVSKRGIAKPTYVPSVMSIGEGLTTRVAIPENLDGARDFFHKARKGCESKLKFYKELRDTEPKSSPRFSHYKDKANEFRRMVNSYRELGRLAFLRDQDGRGSHYNWAKQLPEGKRSSYASETMKEYTRAAKNDPSGVGRWQAQDVFNELKPVMSKKDVAKYTKFFDDMGG